MKLKAMTTAEGMKCSSSRCRHGCMMSPRHKCYNGCANQVPIEKSKDILKDNKA